MRLAARTDANQRSIVQALRKIGASVLLLFRVGHGCPDALVSYRDKLYLMEIKTDDGELTEDERDWMSNWNGPVYVVRSPEQAIETVTRDNR